MERYDEWELKEKENSKRNKKFINEFEKWLNEKKLSNKTIRKHINNSSLYINDYLFYYEDEKMEDGIYSINGFLGGWFIEKCLWSSKNSLKETASSIKKFYECMSEKGCIKKNDYKELCNIIKDNMDSYLEEMDALDEEYYEDFI